MLGEGGEEEGMVGEGEGGGEEGAGMLKGVLGQGGGALGSTLASVCAPASCMGVFIAG